VLCGGIGATVCPGLCGLCIPITSASLALSEPPSSKALPTMLDLIRSGVSAIDLIRDGASATDLISKAASIPATTDDATATVRSPDATTAAVSTATVSAVPMATAARDEVFTSEAPGRCNKEYCAMLYPGPEDPPARSLSDLVQFKGTCLCVMPQLFCLPTHLRARMSSVESTQRNAQSGDASRCGRILQKLSTSAHLARKCHR
jgi:hypothetical protein